MDTRQLYRELKVYGIEAGLVIHRGMERTRLVFKSQANITNAVKLISGRRWSRTLQAWHIPGGDSHLEKLLSHLKLNREEIFRVKAKAELTLIQKASEQEAGKGILIKNQDEQRIEIQLADHVERFSDKIKLKGYSANTLRNYRNHIIQFLKVVLPIKPVDTITLAELEKYLRWRQEHKSVSESDANSHINAIKFYYEQVLGRQRMLFNITRPKKPNQLPAVWAEEDVVKLIKALHNMKHRMMLIMAYAHGMRVSELSTLLISDIDGRRMQIHIKAAKGKKDRVVNLSASTLEVLRSYYLEYRPGKYLFENARTGNPISIRTIQEIFQAAKQRAGLHKKAGMHSLRHSYATHLHEQGVDIKYLKDLLGHNSIHTTERYTHVSKKDISKIHSPFDRLKF